MKRYDVQSIEIDAPFEAVFTFLSDDHNLPRWTHAFASVEGDRAVMRTPAGERTVGLDTHATRSVGTVDTTLTFPDGSTAVARSRLVGDDEHCVYTFVLAAPPRSLQELEGDLPEQSEILAEELRMLKAIFEAEHASDPMGTPT